MNIVLNHRHFEPIYNFAEQKYLSRKLLRKTESESPITRLGNFCRPQKARALLKAPAPFC